MRYKLYLGAYAFLALSVLSCQENRKGKNYNQKLAVDDRGEAFIKDANKAGYVEIKFAKLAQEKSTNKRILNLAKMMRADHSTITGELYKLANDNHVSLADTLLEPEKKQLLESISKLNGSVFDKAFARAMVLNHTAVIEQFKYASTNPNKQIKEFAGKSIPVLMAHLDSAKAIGSSIK